MTRQHSSETCAGLPGRPHEWGDAGMCLNCGLRRAGEQTRITVLWAIHDRYRTPHVVRAWSQALSKCYDDAALLAEAKDWMEHWGDDTGWTYWTTTESIPVADAAPRPEEFV